MAVFQAVRDLMPELSPITAMGDFEEGSEMACIQVFEGIRTVSCFFHYGQCIWRRVQKERLTVLYKTNPKFKTWVRCLMTVPLAPENDIEDLYTELLTEKFSLLPQKDRSKVASFKAYIQKNWRDGISHGQLSAFGQPDATNNPQENFNGRLNKKMAFKHPNHWVFLNKLYEVIQDAEADMERLEDDPDIDITVPNNRYSISLKERRDAERDLLDKNITPMEFVRRLRHGAEGIRRRMQQKMRRAEKRKEELGISLSDDVNENSSIDDVNSNDSSTDVCISCDSPREETYVLFPCGCALYCATCAKDLDSKKKCCIYCSANIIGTTKVKTKM